MFREDGEEAEGGSSLFHALKPGRNRLQVDCLAVPTLVPLKDLKRLTAEVVVCRQCLTHALFTTSAVPRSQKVLFSISLRLTREYKSESVTQV